MKRRLLIVAAGVAALACAGGLMAPAQATICVGGDRGQGRMFGYCVEDPRHVIEIHPEHLDEFIAEQAEYAEEQTMENVEYVQSQVRVDVQIPPLPPAP